jgi:predicted aldo/keto reductase-like oxidoreductase
VAVRFALTHQQISTVLVGFSEMRHLEEAVACSGRPAFSPEQLARLERLYQTAFDRQVEK